MAMLISMVYLEHALYKSFVNNSANSFIIFCKHLATKGICQMTYKERLNLLSTALKQNVGFTHVNIIDARYNVLYIIKELLKDTPSAIEKRTCNKGCLQNDLVQV